MWPDRVSNPGPLTYESGALPIALRSPAPPIVQTQFSSFSAELKYMYFVFFFQTDNR